jgi:hypothetical protein
LAPRTEPSKWNLPGWIWWKLAEPTAGEPDESIHTKTEIDWAFLALVAGGLADPDLTPPDPGPGRPPRPAPVPPPEEEELDVRRDGRNG